MNVDRLRAYREDSKFIDVTVNVGANGYGCHKVVLASASPYFHNMFTMGFRESLPETTSVTIGIADPGNIFGDIVQYLYKNVLALDDQNALFVHVFASYLQLEDLRRRCEHIFSEYTSHKVKHVLRQLKKIDADFMTIPAVIVGLLAKSFNQFANTSTYQKLPVQLLLKIVEHHNLELTSEEQLLDFLITVNRNSDLRPEMRRALGARVCWRSIPRDLGDLEIRPFISPDDARRAKEDRASILDQNRLGGEIAIFLAKSAPGWALNRLMQYTPPRIRRFKEYEFTKNPEKWGWEGRSDGNRTIISMSDVSAVVIEHIEIRGQGYANGVMLQLTPLRGCPLAYEMRMESASRFSLDVDSLTLANSIVFDPRVSVENIKMRGFVCSI